MTILLGLSQSSCWTDEATVTKGGPATVEMPQLGVNYRGAEVEIDWGHNRAKQ